MSKPLKGTVRSNLVQLNGLLVEEVVQRVLVAAQKELRLPNQSATLTRIVLDWWEGRSTVVGHAGFPSE